MSYIGNTSTTQAFTPAIDYFSGNASTTAFTLSKPVASVAQVQVVVNNVAQNPSSAYTVSSNTITFTSAPSAGTNNIYVYYVSPITQAIAPSQGTVTSSSFGVITDFTTTGNTILGDASTDTLNVGNGGLVKDASGNVGIGTNAPSVRLNVQTAATGTTVGSNVIAKFQSNAAGRDATIQLSDNVSSSSTISMLSGATAFSQNGTEAMRIDSSGNVGIGTSSPSAKLTVSDGTVRIDTSPFSATGYQGTQSNHPYAIITNNTERMRIDSSGNVGIGTSSPVGKLDVVSTAQDQLSVRSNNSTAGASILVSSGDGTTSNNYSYIQYQNKQTSQQNWKVGTFGSSAFSFYDATASAERMRIDSSGNLLVGTTSAVVSGKIASQNAGNAPAGVFHVSNTSSLGTESITSVKYDNNSTTSNVFVRFYINNGVGASGTITANGASAAGFTSWSDARLKDNIVDLPPQLANIMALRPVEYDYIESEGGGHQIGFVAQEVQEVYPDLVGERSDGMLTLTDMNKNDARLIKAIQEMKTIIDTQASTIQSLTARITALENK